MSQRNKVDVRIGGKDYTLVGVESDEYIQKVAMYIDKKMVEITRSNSLLSSSMAAVLAAINVADDYFKANELGSELNKEVISIKGQLEKLKNDNKRLRDEISTLNSKSSGLQLQLAKREAELGEVRSSLDKVIRPQQQRHLKSV